MKPAPAVSLEELHNRILAFIARCTLAHPVLKEEGGEPLLLDPARFELSLRSGKLLLEAWDDARSVVLRITGLKRETADELVLRYRRFGTGESSVRILASDKAEKDLRREAARGRFAERLTRMLAQTFPGWKTGRLSTERDLAHSFSAQMARVCLSRGQPMWAVAGCGEDEGESASDAALAQGLAWLDHVRHLCAARRPGKSAHLAAGLKLFVPERFVEPSALRWPYLNTEIAQYELYCFNPAGEIRAVEAADSGNLRTTVTPPTQAVAAAPASLHLMKTLAALPGVELRSRPPLGFTCAVRGLVFARASHDGAFFGFGADWHPLTPTSAAEARRLAGEIVRVRVADSPNRRHSFYTAHPERWLESELLADISRLSAEFDPRFVYSQVVTTAGRERGIIDLLAVTRAGRLAVIELKATADLNLPLQALDYWIGVQWHHARGEFRRLGYFPGIELTSEPPLLFLVAPAYEFHSLNEIVLRYVSPAVPVRKIGLNHEWRQGVIRVATL